MERKRRKLHSVFVIVGLIGALFLVVYAMQYTRSENFQSSLALLFGQPTAQEKSWNWCPKNAERIEYSSQASFKTGLSLADICFIGIEPVSAEHASRPLKKLLLVYGPDSEKTLEADSQLEVFQVDGLIFQSKKLSSQLK